MAGISAFKNRSCITHCDGGVPSEMPQFDFDGRVESIRALYPNPKSHTSLPENVHNSTPSTPSELNFWPFESWECHVSNDATMRAAPSTPPELNFWSFESWESHLSNDAKISVWGVHDAELWTDSAKTHENHRKTRKQMHILLAFFGVFIINVCLKSFKDRPRQRLRGWFWRRLKDMRLSRFERHRRSRPRRVMDISKKVVL